MAKEWFVTRNNGSIAEIVQGTKLKEEVKRPVNVSEEDFLDLLKPGTLVDDFMVQHLLADSKI